MNLPQELARQFNDVHLTKDWVSTTSLKTQLEAVDWQQATTKIGSLNTIAALAFHLNYYIDGINRVLEGGALDIHDALSFNAPPISSQEDWQALKNKLYADAEKFARLVAQLTPADLEAPFANMNYGSNYHNLNAMIQHIYYHLGQIVVLRKLVENKI